MDSVKFDLRTNYFENCYFVFLSNSLLYRSTCSSLLVSSKCKIVHASEKSLKLKKTYVCLYSFELSLDGNSNVYTKKMFTLDESSQDLS